MAEVAYHSAERHRSVPSPFGRDRTWELVGADGEVRETTVSVVVPARNESLNLPYVLPQLPVGLLEIIVVDGNSVDGTAEVARALRPEVRVIGQPGKGKGDALRAGFSAARGDIIVMLDADGSMSPLELPRYIEALVAGADVVTGSRMMDGGGSADITWLRQLGNDVLGRAFTLLYGRHHSDLCYGYMGFWRRVVTQLHLDADGFEIETLVNVRAALAGLAVDEVPSREARRLHGDSNLRTFRDGSRVLRTLVVERLRWASSRSRRTSMRST